MHRQPGSAIKPLLVYTPAIEHRYFANSKVTDKEIKNGPKNVTGKYIGATTIQEAVIKSINTIPHQIIQEVGVVKSLNYLKEMNFTKIVKEDERPTSAIGGMTYGATPLEMAGGFSTLARNGEYLEPTSITVIKDTKENDIYRFKKQPKRVYDAGASYLMTKILEKTAENKGKTGLSGQLEGHATAVKTGTTNDIRDVWYVGYTPHYTTSVWVGEDTPKRMDDKTSYDDPLNIWHRIMTEINKTKPQVVTFAKPKNALFKGYVDPRTNRVSYSARKGWYAEEIPLIRMKRQEEADARAEEKRQLKIKEQAKIKAEEAKKKAEELAKQKEIERKADEKLDIALQAQGTTLLEEKRKVMLIERLLSDLKANQVYSQSAYPKADQDVATLQEHVNSLFHFDYREKYQNILNTEIDRIADQKDQVERAIIYKKEQAEIDAIRAEEAKIQEQKRLELQAELERKKREAQIKLDRERAKAEQERLEKEKKDREQKEKEEANKPKPPVTPPVTPVVPPVTETPDTSDGDESGG
jgi:penicillin-binding protein 1A